MGQKYTELSSSKTTSVFKLIDKQDKSHGFHVGHVKIMSQDLSFAEGWEKLNVEDYSTVPFQSKFYLKHDKTIRPIQYSQDPWDDNRFDQLHLDLNSQNIAAYIQFYFACFVSGSDILKPVSFTDEIEWQSDLTPTMRQSLDKDFILYPQIIQKGDDFIVKMPCVFRQSIMIVTFYVEQDGHIKIQEKHSLVDDLPIRHFA